MKTACVRLESIGAYQQSRYHETPKLNKEGNDAYEERTWRERCHYSSPDEIIFIPGEQFKNAVCEMAQYLSEKIPGKRNSTWTKHFRSGLRVATQLTLNVRKDEVEGYVQLGNSQGKRGTSGSKVKKYFPLIKQWSGDVEFIIMDDTITRDIFENYLRQAGILIGIGKQRPGNGGDFGRFAVKNIVWKDIEV